MAAPTAPPRRPPPQLPTAPSSPPRPSSAEVPASSPPIPTRRSPPRPSTAAALSSSTTSPPPTPRPPRSPAARTHSNDDSTLPPTTSSSQGLSVPRTIRRELSGGSESSEPMSIQELTQAPAPRPRTARPPSSQNSMVDSFPGSVSREDGSSENDTPSIPTKASNDLGSEQQQDHALKRDSGIHLEKQNLVRTTFEANPQTTTSAAESDESSLPMLSYEAKTNDSNGRVDVVPSATKSETTLPPKQAASKHRGKVIPPSATNALMDETALFAALQSASFSVPSKPGMKALLATPQDGVKDNNSTEEVAKDVKSVEHFHDAEPAKTTPTAEYTAAAVNPDMMNPLPTPGATVATTIVNPIISNTLLTRSMSATTTATPQATSTVSRHKNKVLPPPSTMLTNLKGITESTPATAQSQPQPSPTAVSAKHKGNVLPPPTTTVPIPVNTISPPSPTVEAMKPAVAPKPNLLALTPTQTVSAKHKGKILPPPSSTLLQASVTASVTSTAEVPPVSSAVPVSPTAVSAKHKGKILPPPATSLTAGVVSPVPAKKSPQAPQTEEGYDIEEEEQEEGGFDDEDEDQDGEITPMRAGSAPGGPQQQQRRRRRPVAKSDAMLRHVLVKSARISVLSPPQAQTPAAQQQSVSQSRQQVQQPQQRVEKKEEPIVFEPPAVIPQSILELQSLQASQSEHEAHVASLKQSPPPPPLQHPVTFNPPAYRLPTTSTDWVRLSGMYNRISGRDEGTDWVTVYLTPFLKASNYAITRTLVASIAKDLKRAFRDDRVRLAKHVTVVIIALCGLFSGVLEIEEEVESETLFADEDRVKVSVSAVVRFEDLISRGDVDIVDWLVKGFIVGLVGSDREMLGFGVELCKLFGVGV